ncbi:multiple sugar transport system substrate-binding protein [Jiangella alkaliphila]|uniref:Multiple sugar transport system substrate-binding protein n=2 Tax=Jiangella alkaliphila TaxID=419479 RepID=A0A1H2JJ14_9ACTN|nr:multiple sugar transport system substrate-binding protein [Jiangella alkaliphila]
MAAAAAAYRAVRPDVVVRCEARPLALFNDQPPWELGDGYDLAFVDHPMTGAAAERGALVPLDAVLPAERLARIAADSLGHDAYAWGGRQWALSVDVACQVAVVRADRLEVVPRTWDDVLALAGRTAGAVALTLAPADALCTLVSLSANAALAAGEPATWLRPEAVEFLVELARLAHPVSIGLTPPRLLEHLAGDGGIVYAPFVFGYAVAARGPLVFTDVPGVDGHPRGAILGGAGLAVLPGGRHVAEAAAFAAWCMSADVQRTVLLTAGGQPGHGAVWDDPASGAFFRDIRRSLAQAYVRPRDPWWPAYHRVAGGLLAEALRDGDGAASIHRRLADLADRHREGVPSEAHAAPTARRGRRSRRVVGRDRTPTGGKETSLHGPID